MCKLELGLGSCIPCVIASIIAVIITFSLFEGITKRVDLGKGILKGLLFVSLIGIIVMYLIRTNDEDNPREPSGNGLNGTSLTPIDGYCCVPVPYTISSTKSQIFISFFTDESTVDKGFNISYFSDGITTTTQTTTTTTTTTTSTTTTMTMPVTTSVVTWTPSSTTATPSTFTTDTTSTISSATMTTFSTNITTLITIPSTTTTFQSTTPTGTTLTTTFPLTSTTPSADSMTSITTPTTKSGTTPTTKSGTMMSVTTMKATGFSTDTTTKSFTTSNSPAGTYSTTSFTTNNSTADISITSPTTSNSPAGTNSPTRPTTINSPTGSSLNENWKYIMAGCVSGLILLSVIITIIFFCYQYYKKVSTVYVLKQRPHSVHDVRPSSFEANQKAIHDDATTSYVPNAGENKRLPFEQTRNLFEIDSPIGKANLLPPIESRLVKNIFNWIQFYDFA